MNIELKIENESVNVKINEKNLNYENIFLLEKKIKKCLKNKKIKNIIFDLQSVEYMDTAGLSFFIYILQNVKVKLEIINVFDKIKYVFGLDSQIQKNIK
jgi:anti-anti-sigma factor